MTPDFRNALTALFAIQFFSWSAMFALWIYAMPLIAGQILHRPLVGAGLQAVLVTVSLCYATYALLGTLGGFVLPGLIDRFGHGMVLGLCLMAGAAGLAQLSRATGVGGMIAAFVAIGIGWSAMGSVPYALLARLVPEGRGAHFTRILGFSTVLPQIVTTLGLALFAPQLLGTDPARVIALAAAAMALAGTLSLLLRGSFAAADANRELW